MNARNNPTPTDEDLIDVGPLTWLEITYGSFTMSADVPKEALEAMAQGLSSAALAQGYAVSAEDLTWALESLVPGQEI